MSRGAWRRLLPAAVGGGLLAAAALLLPLHDAWQAMWNQAIGLHLDSRSATSGLSVLGALTARWPLALIALIGGVVGWRRHPRLVIAGVLWLAGAVLAMAITRPLWRPPRRSGVTWLRAALRSRCVVGILSGSPAPGAATPLLSRPGSASRWAQRPRCRYGRGFRGLPPTVDLTALAAAIRAHTSQSSSARRRRTVRPGAGESAGTAGLRRHVEHTPLRRAGRIQGPRGGG